MLAVAGEDRARRDLARSIDARTRSIRPVAAPDGVAIVPWLETVFAIGGALLPAGMPAEWLGQSFEVYGIPTAATATVSFAVRWHGDRPAVLWEQTGTPRRLTAPVAAPDWSTDEPTGEALWPPAS